MTDKIEIVTLQLAAETAVAKDTDLALHEFYAVCEPATVLALLKRSDEMARRVRNLKNLVDVQCSDCNWNYDDYMRGMANGLLVAMSCFDNSEPKFKEAQKEYIADRARTATVQSVGEDQEFRNLMHSFQREAVGHGRGALDAVIRHIDSLLVARPSAAVSVPTLHQYRTKPDWDDQRGWGEWTTCSPEAYEDYKRMPQLHNWRYEVRALYTSPPQAESVMGSLRDIVFDGPDDPHVPAESVSTAGAVEVAIEKWIRELDFVHQGGSLPAGQIQQKLRAILATPPAVTAPDMSEQRGSKLASVREQELMEEVTALKTELLAVRYAQKTPIAADLGVRDAAMKLAYGYLWHICNDPDTPREFVVTDLSASHVAFIARGILRDALNQAQRGEGINEARRALRSQPVQKGGA